MLLSVLAPPCLLSTPLSLLRRSLPRYVHSTAHVRACMHPKTCFGLVVVCGRMLANQKLTISRQSVSSFMSFGDLCNRYLGLCTTQNFLHLML